MQAFITALTGENGISASTFWNDIASLVPFIVIVFGVAFGYRLLRKSIKGASKAKVNI